MSEQQPLQYLVPRRIYQGYQFFPGWGFLQVGVVLAGLAAGVVLALAAHVAHANVFWQAAPLFLGGLLGFGVARPQPDGSNMLDRLAAWRTWSRRQRQYLYDWGRDDWPK